MDVLLAWLIGSCISAPFLAWFLAAHLEEENRQLRARWLAERREHVALRDAAGRA